MLFAKVLKSKAAGPTLLSPSCITSSLPHVCHSRYWLFWLLFNHMAVLWHEVSCILLGTCKVHGLKGIFCGLFSTAIRGSRSNNHTTELLSASLLWSFSASAGDGFYVTWNYSRAQKRKKNKPQKIQPTINTHTQSFKGIAHYFVGHGFLPPVVKVKTKSCFFLSKCHSLKSKLWQPWRWQLSSSGPGNVSLGFLRCAPLGWEPCLCLPWQSAIPVGSTSLCNIW